MSTVTATQIRREFQALRRRVAAGERLIVAAHGRRVLALVSLADLMTLQDLDASRGPRPAETVATFDTAGLCDIGPLQEFDTSGLRTFDAADLRRL